MPEDRGSRVSRQIDRIVGQTIRRWRRDAGQTQQQVAERLGVSYQQLQKYEAGSNRISAGRLYEIASCFGRRVNEAFVDVPAPLAAQVDAIEHRPDAETRELHRNFEALTDSELRASIGGLIKTLSGRRRPQKR